jgi:Tfp pilus assembly protein PilN
MINLLPPAEKEILTQEETWKLTVILGILVLVFLVSFSLILFSIKTYLAGEVEVQEIFIDQRTKELQNPQMESLQKNLINFNQTLIQLESFYRGQFKVTEILEKISRILPSETYLTNLSISLQSDKKGKRQVNCNLSGFASTRETLLKFKENLEKEEIFEEIYFPPANWVKPSDINFTVNFKIR